MQQGNISSDFVIKSSNESENTIISGYASVFDVPDAHNDIILQGAFQNINKAQVKLLWQHDSLKPIGIINYLMEDERGLKMTAEINLKTSIGRETAELIKQKAIDGLSIGFIIKSYEYNNEGQRIISDIDLKEISIVTFPANQNANILYVKSITEPVKTIYQKSLDKLLYLTTKLTNF